MITDGFLYFSDQQDLTNQLSGTATPVVSTSNIDFAQKWDAGPSCLKIWAECRNMPTSDDPDAMLAVLVEVSKDNTTWTKLVDFPGRKVSEITINEPWVVRSDVPIAGDVYRYMRLTYTPSAPLKTGTISAGINLNVPAQHAYPSNYRA